MISFRSVAEFLTVAFKTIPVSVCGFENANDDLGYLALGDIAAVILTGGPAAKTKLGEAGLNINILNSIEECASHFKDIVAEASAIEDRTQNSNHTQKTRRA